MQFTITNGRITKRPQPSMLIPFDAANLADAQAYAQAAANFLKTTVQLTTLDPYQVNATYSPNAGSTTPPASVAATTY